MKKTITLIFLSLAPAFLAAAPISRAKARAIASQAFNRLNPSLSQPVDFNLEAKVKGRTLQADAESPAYYAFNNAGGNGFAIIAGDDLFPQMVAYSDKGQFTDEAEMAPALVEFLQAYAAYVEAVRNGEAEAPARRVPGDITGDVVVEPLLSTVWGQGSPYNYYCPNQWPVGCVATAMSQIMNYWKFPASGKGEVTYGGSEYMITVNFAESTYDWSIMKDKFAQLDWKKDAGKNVAKLCFDCGVACYMEYDQTGSGATIVDAYNAFSQHFKYNAESITLLMREAMDSQEEWNDILFAELDARRPVLYAGASSSGGGPDAAGHAFVIDGYDSNHIVHVNWGWNGDNNGYYDITLLNPGGYTFSQRQEMVVGIIPDENEEHTQRKQFLRDALVRLTQPLHFCADLRSGLAETRRVRLLRVRDKRLCGRGGARRHVFAARPARSHRHETRPRHALYFRARKLSGQFRPPDLEARVEVFLKSSLGLVSESDLAFAPCLVTRRCETAHAPRRAESDGEKQYQGKKTHNATPQTIQTSDFTSATASRASRAVRIGSTARPRTMSRKYRCSAS